MAAVLVDVEAALVSYLEPVLGVQIGTRVPRERPAQFVVLSSAGGPVLSVGLSRARVIVQCWGETRTVAWDLTQRTWSAMFAVDEADTHRGMAVTAVDLTTAVNNPDNASGMPRYQFIATLTVAIPHGA